MNRPADPQLIASVAEAQRGVFGISDLRALLDDAHDASFYRRVARLEDSGELRRFTKGVYVARDFDLPSLCQRVAPGSAISFEWVLARELLIGPKPMQRLSALRNGRPRSFRGCDVAVTFHHAGTEQRFGEEVRDGIRCTVPEKAALDVLCFHLRGRRALFDIRSDLRLDGLDAERLRDYLDRYQNPKFRAFAGDVLRLGLT